MHTNDYPRLVVDNSGGGLVFTEQRRVKLDLLVGAKLTEPPMNRQTVREAAKPSPVADASGAHAKRLRHGGRASKGINRFIDSHSKHGNPSSLDKSSGLDVGQPSHLERAIIAGMEKQQKSLPVAHPRHIDAIAGRLYQLRSTVGISQRAFAKRAGLGFTTYNNYETGVSRPDLDNANRICDEFQVTLDWIYRGNPAGLPYELASKLIRTAS